MHPADAAEQPAAHRLPVLAGAGDASRTAAHRGRAPSGRARTRPLSSALPAPLWKKAGHGRRAISAPGPTGWRDWAPPAGCLPSGASTRHNWRISARKLSADSRPWMIRMRSKKTSGNGSASSSHSSAAFLSCRPGDHARRRGHGGDGALRPAECRQIGQRKAVAQQAVISQVGPEILDLAQDRAPRQLAQRGFIKSGEVADILRHGCENRPLKRLFKGWLLLTLDPKETL